MTREWTRSLLYLSQHHLGVRLLRGYILPVTTNKHGHRINILMGYQVSKVQVFKLRIVMEVPEWWPTGKRNLMRVICLWLRS
jgi:hypothetical protein